MSLKKKAVNRPWEEPEFGAVYKDKLYNMVGKCYAIGYHFSGCTTAFIAGKSKAGDFVNQQVVVSRLEHFEGDPIQIPEHVKDILGSTYKSITTGVTGVAISYMVNQYEQNKIVIEWLRKDGEITSAVFDEGSLEFIKPKKKEEKKRAREVNSGTGSSDRSLVSSAPSLAFP